MANVLILFILVKYSQKISDLNFLDVYIIHVHAQLNLNCTKV